MVLKDIVICSYHTFKENLPNGFSIFNQDDSTIISDDTVTVIESGIKSSSVGALCQLNFISTEKEMRIVADRILSRPLLIMVTCRKTVPVAKCLDDRGKMRSMFSTNTWGSNANEDNRQHIAVDFAILVNTKNHRIKRQLLDAFDEIYKNLANYAKFSVEISFNEAICEWWKHRGPEIPAKYLTDARCTGAKITIANHKPIDHFYDFGIIWILTLPIYMTCVLPLRLWRTLVEKVKDAQFKIQANITVIYDDIQNEISKFSEKDD